MFSLSDIFTPSFFLILGIIVMLIALLVIYIENKWREQNHKITSMLSLVSSLAEEMNSMRFHLMSGQVPSGGSGVESSLNNSSLNPPTFFPHFPANISTNNNNLIEISEDEGDEGDDEDDEDDEEDEDYEDAEDDDDEKTTIFKLNISGEENEEEDDLDEEDDDLEGDEFNKKNKKHEIIEIGTEPEVKVLKINDLIQNNLEGKMDLNSISDLETLESVGEENLFKNSSDLKSISFSIEEVDKDLKNDHINKDLKKAPLNVLKNLVIEKKIMNDPSKLKKHELLKLLGIE